MLLKTTLRKHNINDWHSIEKSIKNENNETTVIDVEFLQQIMEFGNRSVVSNCVKCLQKLIKDGFDHNKFPLLNFIKKY